MTYSTDDRRDLAPGGDNRLAALAADIKALEARIRRTAEEIATDAIDAGHKLIEAKAALKHGAWLPWLRQHCAMSERTARLCGPLRSPALGKSRAQTQCAPALTQGISN